MLITPNRKNVTFERVKISNAVKDGKNMKEMQKYFYHVDQFEVFL